MLHRTRETAEYFDENIYAVKQMKLLDEIVVPPFGIELTEEPWRV